jgi:hypothetical protein
LNAACHAAEHGNLQMVTHFLPLCVPRQPPSAFYSNLIRYAILSGNESLINYVLSQPSPFADNYILLAAAATNSERIFGKVLERTVAEKIEAPKANLLNRRLGQVHCVPILEKLQQMQPEVNCYATGFEVGNPVRYKHRHGHRQKAHRHT